MTPFSSIAGNSRRHFLQLAGTTVLPPVLSAASEPTNRNTRDSGPVGRAENCILLWLGGGACHVDTWDPKRKGDGKKIAGSYTIRFPRLFPVCRSVNT